MRSTILAILPASPLTSEPTFPSLSWRVSWRYRWPQMLLFISILKTIYPEISLIKTNIFPIVQYLSLSICTILIFDCGNIKRRLYVYFRQNHYLFLLSFLFISWLLYQEYAEQVWFVLIFAVIGVVTAMLLAFVLLTKESLPFVACFVLVLCYFWSSFRSEFGIPLTWPF